MNEISLLAEPPVVKEIVEQVDFAEVLRLARAPIVKEGFAEPWAEDPAVFDPAQAGWEQAAGNVLAKIQKMQSSGLVQLTPEGLTPKQAAEKTGDLTKLAEANRRAAELAERLRQRQPAAPAPLLPSPVEAPAPAAAPREQWGQLPDDQRNADLGEWYRKLQAGEPIEDWQRQALKDFNVWVGDSPPPAEAAAGSETQVVSDEEEVIPPAAKEELAGAAADSLAGAGGKIRRFFESKKGQTTLEGVEFAIGGLVGVAVAEISKLDPAWEAGIVITAQSALGLSRLGTELGARTIEAAEGKFPRFARLSARLAGEKGLSGVLRSIKNLITRIQYRSFLVGFSAGIIGQLAFETIAGHSIFPDVSAAETTVGGGIPEVQAPGGGEWPSESRFAGSQPAAAEQGGQVSVGINPVDQPSPVEDWTGAAGAEPPAGAVGGNTEVPTATAGSESTATVGPTVTTESTATGTEALPAAGAPEAATRVVEVQSGDTLTDLVARAGGDPYGADFTNTVLQSEGVLTGPQNPNRDMARALIEFIKAHPGGVNWRDAINGVGALAEEIVGGVPLKDAIAQATRMIYSGQEMNVVVGAVMP